VGSNTVASGSNATALGNSVQSSGDGAIAAGNNSNASGNGSTALGFAASASGLYATASGPFSTAAGDEATASGYGATAEASGAHASGYGACATQTKSGAFGYRACALTANVQELAYYSNSTTRAGAVRVHGTGYVAISTPQTDTAFTDGGAPPNGDEADGTIFRKGLAFRVSTADHLIATYCKADGTIISRDLGHMT
jgi:trimeric autotransporter adhesin